jgi:hypothetical protein
VLRSLHCAEPNRADRAAQSTGYYAGLIDGPSTGRDELTLTLLGKPPGWVHFTDIQAARFLRGDFLQFELKPDLNTWVLGTRFTTNSLGLRDRASAREKPAETFRIALLGSSIDMGWGVNTDDTYENRLEDWLNAHAAKRGVKRRFEVLNFAMAAYSPLHRIEVFGRKAREFRPDLVLYSATRLDRRLLQIHLVGLLQDGVDLKYAFLRRAVHGAGIDPNHLERDAEGKLRGKDEIKNRLNPWLLPIEEAALGHLAGLCREQRIPLACVLVPRACEDDRAELRAADVARMRAMAHKHGLSVLDLCDAFDDEDPGAIEIAPWDDHPNKLGHELLFLALGRQIAASRELYRLIFGVEPREVGCD